MTALDQHIISSLSSLSEEGKIAAIQLLATKKKAVKKEKNNEVLRRKMIKTLFKPKS